MFTVSESEKVVFSPSNLYDQWRQLAFRKKQYSVNQDMSDGMRPDYYDLFSIGADGRIFNFDIKDISENYRLFTESASWTLLTRSEWHFLLFERDSSIVAGVRNARFVKCLIRGTACLMLFPDEFVFPNGVACPPRMRINDKGGDFRDVSYSYSEVEILEKAGVVFLPAISWDFEDSMPLFSSLCYHSEKLAGYYLMRSETGKSGNLMLVFSDNKLFFDRCKNTNLYYMGLVRLVKFV